MAAFRDDMKALMRRLTRETGVVPTETTATLLAPLRARASRFSGTLGRVLSRLRPSLGLAEAPREPPAAGVPSRPSHWGSENRPHARRAALPQPGRRRRTPTSTSSRSPTA